MDIKLVHSEVKFFKHLDNKELTIELIRRHIQMDSYLYPLEKYRFKDNYKTLSKNLYKSLIKYPKLKGEIKNVSNSLNIDIEYILSSIKKLGDIINYKKPINVCTAITGFDCAAGAYGDTIYFGLEWLTNPDNVGVSTTDYRYDFMFMLSARVNEFVEETIPHEVVHIMSIKPADDDFMFRIIEEGRACYVTHLLNPEWSLEKIMPMNIIDLEHLIENEEELMRVAYQELSNDMEKTIKNLFSPIGQFMTVKLGGYYLAYKLIEKCFMDIDSFEEKVIQIMKFTDGKQLYQLLSNYNNYYE